MTLKEAIKILKELSCPGKTYKFPDDEEAIQLSIEALDRCHQFKSSTPHYLYVPLQHESEATRTTEKTTS